MTDTLNGLLPCPFCGSRAVTEINAYGIRCTNCWAEIDNQRTAAAAKAAWNLRDGARSEMLGDNVDYKKRCDDLEWANKCLTKQLQEHIDLLAQTKPMRETVTLSETEVESAMGDFIEEWSASSIYEAVPRFMKIYKLSKIEVGGSDV